MSNAIASEFFSTVGSDKALTMKFLAATDGKHSEDALVAIADFARDLGFDLSFDDIRAVRVDTNQQRG